MKASTTRRPARVLALTAACGLAILSLSGCIKVNADLTIDPEAQGSGTFAFELQKQAAGFLGISDLDGFSSQLTSGDLSQEGFSALGTCDASETADAFVYTCAFTSTSFTEEGGMWTIEKKDDSIVFHMVNEGTGDTQGSDASALLGDASMGDITVNVTFPGPIKEITGDGATKTSDTQATISATMTDTLDVTITSGIESGSPISGILVVLVGLAVVALIVIVLIVLLMRRKRPDAVADESAFAAPVAGAAAAAADPATEVVADEAVVAEGVVVEDVVVETIVMDDAGVVEETTVIEEAVVAPVVDEAVVDEPGTDTGTPPDPT